jgi:hypothetical protein
MVHIVIKVELYECLMRMPRNTFSRLAKSELCREVSLTLIEVEHPLDLSQQAESCRRSYG